MRSMSFTQAVDDALAQAMADDPRIVVFGEDIPLLRRDLLVRFRPEARPRRSHQRKRFRGCWSRRSDGRFAPRRRALHGRFRWRRHRCPAQSRAKIEAFSGGKWKAPVVVRAPCSGGYGDGGQHEQSLWGWLAHIPGLTVIVPCTPADAGGLMLAALQHDGPTVFLEPKLLSESWLEFLGSGGRQDRSVRCAR